MWTQIREWMSRFEPWLYPLCYFAKHIEHHRLYYGCNVLCGELRVARSGWHLTHIALGIFFIAISGVNMAWDAGLGQPVSYLDRSYHIPVEIRPQVFINTIIWSVMMIAQASYVFRTKLSDYKLMAVFVVKNSHKPLARITDHNLGLVQCDKLVRFRDKTLVLFTIIIIEMTAITGTLIALWTYFHRPCQSFPTIIFFWMIIDFLWLLGASSVTYGLPVVILILTYYIWLKRLVLFDKMDKLNHLFALSQKHYYITISRKMLIKVAIWHRLLEINRQYARLQSEVATYNRDLLQRCLSILLAGNVVIITYLTYIVLYTRIPSYFKPVFWLLYPTQVVPLVSLILTCARIGQMSRVFTRKLAWFYSLGQGLYGFGELLKIDTIEQSLLRSKCGFSLVNHTRVNKNLLFLMFYYISVLFFMVCKRN